MPFVTKLSYIFSSTLFSGEEYLQYDYQYYLRLHNQNRAINNVDQVNGFNSDDGPPTNMHIATADQNRSESNLNAAICFLSSRIFE